MDVQLLPQVNQRSGCSAVLQDCPPSLWKGALEKASHLQPYIIGPETDTKVTLNISNGPKTWPFEADLRDTVDQIKKKIMEGGKCGLGTIGLIYGNQELQGPKTLGQHRVTNLATLFIVHKCHGEYKEPHITSPGTKTRQISTSLPGFRTRMTMEFGLSNQPQVHLRDGCSQVQIALPPRVCNGPIQQASHLHPSIIGPETDTSVTLTITNGIQTLCLEANLHDTVNQIKERINQERKLGGGSICLWHGNQELRGTKTLAQQNVKHQAMLFIVHRCNGG